METYPGEEGVTEQMEAYPGEEGMMEQREAYPEEEGVKERKRGGKDWRKIIIISLHEVIGRVGPL